MTPSLNICLLSSLGAALVTALMLPLWRTWCRRIGLVDDPGHRKIHEQPTPLAGGLAIFTGLLLTLFAAWAIPNFINAETSRQLTQQSTTLTVILIGAAAMTLLGLLDDKFELRPIIKFTGQLLIAVIVTAAGVRLSLLVAHPLLNHALTILWILTVTNAFNFMDNMNGLCAGLGVIAAVFIGSIAVLHSQFPIAMLAFAMGGAALGFLPGNYPRATIFLGDAGSHLIGFLLAVLTIQPDLWTSAHPTAALGFGPILLLAVPLLDLISVILIRTRMGKPFYTGDNNHLSHRLVRRGFSRTAAVALIWTLSILCGSVAFLL